MMCQISDELHEVTSALPSTSPFTMDPAILDLCMAPGGFTTSVFKRNCYARVCGISLPVSRGGHEMILPKWQSDPRIRVRFLDIIMLAAEMDVTNVPAEHPDATNFVFDRPFYGEAFDLVLRTHSRAEYREKREVWRLLTSQLVLALQRVKQDGKIVILLYKLEAWDTVLLLYTLRKFSLLQLFKPQRKYVIRSSFYVVAEQIQTQSLWF
ncbi:methyltransferase family [Pyrenophora seminiperda CCB06]|uniref:Methyltransferase family n=1 Tax=Pyrenophora seminiperda CCB06 TaxID=1302712 RepID=A0A3M7LZV8_9PLEO|nr:methyltransferase family [Pyrenophora seminiperda CCB06]